LFLRGKSDKNIFGICEKRFAYPEKMYYICIIKIKTNHLNKEIMAQIIDKNKTKFANKEALMEYLKGEIIRENRTTNKKLETLLTWNLSECARHGLDVFDFINILGEQRERGWSKPRGW